MSYNIKTSNIQFKKNHLSYQEPGRFKSNEKGKTIDAKLEKIVVQSLSCARLCDPMDCPMPGLPILHISQSLLKLMSIELVILSNHLILSRPLLLLSSVFPGGNSKPHQYSCLESPMNSMKRQKADRDVRIKAVMIKASGSIFSSTDSIFFF